MSNPANDITGIVLLMLVIGLVMILKIMISETMEENAADEAPSMQAEPVRLVRIQPAVAIEPRREIVLTVTEKGRDHV